MNITLPFFDNKSPGEIEFVSCGHFKTSIKEMAVGCNAFSYSHLPARLGRVPRSKALQAAGRAAEQDHGNKERILIA
jgi:hypothetical protein